MIQSTPYASEPTLSNVLGALARHGYTASFVPLPGGRVGCPALGIEAPASSLVVEALRRFEGVTNPGDEAIVVAGRLAGPDGDVLGTLVLTYGPAASAVDGELLWQLNAEPESLWHTGKPDERGELR